MKIEYNYFFFGSSQSSTSVPFVDFGCKNAMFKPSAPLRGALSISLQPFSSASASAFATPSSTANATCWIPPRPPLFAMNFEIALSSDVPSRSSIFV